MSARSTDRYLRRVEEKRKKRALLRTNRMPRDIIGAIKYRYRNICKPNESINGLVVLPISERAYYDFLVNDKR